MSFKKILFLAIPATLIAKSLEEKDQELCERMLEHYINKAAQKGIPYQKAFRYFLTTLGGLYLLSKYGKPSERLRYKNMIGLLFFNHESDFRDPYFKEAMQIFREVGGHKALLRAAYSAWSIKEDDLARSLFQAFKESLGNHRLSKVEEGMRRILQKNL